MQVELRWNETSHFYVGLPCADASVTSIRTLFKYIQGRANEISNRCEEILMQILNELSRL